MPTARPLEVELSESNMTMSTSLGGSPSSPAALTTSATPLNLVPEKAMLGHQIRSTVAAQYWGPSVASTSAPDGSGAMSISDPSPLPLLVGSGLSRPHLILATQALKLPGQPSPPGLPSFCGSQGGMVIDRMLPIRGGEGWWAVLGGRMRLGRLAAAAEGDTGSRHNRAAEMLAAVADPSCYSLGATARVQLSRHTVLRSRLDWSPPADSHRSLCNRQNRQQQQQAQQHLQLVGNSDSIGAALATAPNGLANNISTATGSSSSSSSLHPPPTNSAAGRRWAAAAPSSRSSTPASQLSYVHAPSLSSLLLQPLSLSCQLKSRCLGAGTETRADLALGQRMAIATTCPNEASVGAGTGTGTGTATARTPLLLGLQAGTAAASRAPFVWRCGVLQVTAPPAIQLSTAAVGSPISRRAGSRDLAEAAEELRDDGEAAGADVGQDWSLRSAVYLQGTAAVQGERYLWRAPKKFQRRNQAVATSANAASAAATTGGGGAGDTTAVAATGGGSASLPPSPGLGPHNPVRQAASYMLSRIGGGGARGGDDEDNDSDRGRVGGGAAAAGVNAPFGVSLPSANQVQESLIDATQSLSRLRDDVTHATQWVGGGGLVEQLEQGDGVGGGGERRMRRPWLPMGQQAQSVPPATPWSSFVGEPHVRVAGIVGVTARTPLIHVTHGSAPPSASSQQPHAPSQHLFPMRVAWLQDWGLKRLLSSFAGNGGGGGGGNIVEANDHNHHNVPNNGFNDPYYTAGSGNSNTSSSAHAAHAQAPLSVAGSSSGTPPAGAMRPFASAGLQVQAGRFSSWFLDFTRLAVQLDAGLWGPKTSPAPALLRPQQGLSGLPAAPFVRHPAFAIGDTGAWHCASLSLCQQLLGPLRLSADWRFRLESNCPLLRPPQEGSGAGAGACSASSAAAVAAAEGGGSSGRSRLLGHLGGMRGRLAEAVYGLDLAVPGVAGAARLVAWYCPQRREGMLEVRLF
ncbi:hypothetical protein Agub_g11514 [Astrephomene gubernaculifera]|uniref:Uncharacterized protein n=1 Tax=Astrephomene gubernaculifera TaxID=47775 RepID=A0AAD3DWN1_9CHLO|nr:hypothetical protein Agub_g11514 [Astrephomene gubernaculifera]